MDEPISTQRGVAAGMAAGAIVTAVVFVFAEQYVPAASAYQQSHTIALAWLLLPLPLVFTIARLASHRFFNAADIDAAVGGPPSARARQLQAMLQNTLEQTVLLSMALVGYGNYRGYAYWVVTVALFLTGRVLFFATYARGAAARSFGFALSFYPTLLLLGLAMVDWFKNPQGVIY